LEWWHVHERCGETAHRMHKVIPMALGRLGLSLGCSLSYMIPWNAINSLFPLKILDYLMPRETKKKLSRFLCLQVLPLSTKKVIFAFQEVR
jgi:hypothetical protein